MNSQLPVSKNELFRKAIHISSSAIPIGYYFLDKKIVLCIIIPITVLLLIVELLKHKVDFIHKLYLIFFKDLLRDHEHDRKAFRVNGASWVMIGDALSIIIFPKYIAIIGMLLLSLADSISALAGMVFAKTYYSKNRSYVGSITFFLIGIIIVLITPKFFYCYKEYLIGFISVFFTTIADAIGLPADDNLLIPIVSCAVLYVLYIIFFPHIIALKLF